MFRPFFFIWMQYIPTSFKAKFVNSRLCITCTRYQTAPPAVGPTIYASRVLPFTLDLRTSPSRTRCSNFAFCLSHLNSSERNNLSDFIVS